MVKGSRKRAGKGGKSQLGVVAGFLFSVGPPRRTIPRNLEQIFYHSFVTSFGCHALERKSVESSFVLESRREEGKEEGRKVGGEGSRDEEGSGAKEEAGRCRDRVLRGRGV